MSAEIGQCYKLTIFIPTLPQRDYSALDSELQILKGLLDKVLFLMPNFPDCSEVSITFQDSLDAFLLAMMLSCWEFKADTFFQEFWSEGFYVIARAKARSNPAFTDLKRSEVGWFKMSEMSDLGNQIVRLFALFVPIFALISRVDFSQPHIFLSF